MAQATDVYRSGRRDVHHAFRSGGVEFEHDSCRLDGRGNAWFPVPPPGPRCGVCFAGLAKRTGPGRSQAPLALTAASLALAAAIFGTSLGEPVNFFPTASGDVTSAPSASVTPGPSVVPPLPTAPVLTPAPVGTLQPVPTYPPVPTFGPLPTWPPFPQLPPLPTLAPPKIDPTPLPRLCVHPGIHVGVLDLCKWPHN